MAHTRVNYTHIHERLRPENSSSLYNQNEDAKMRETVTQLESKVKSTEERLNNVSDSRDKLIEENRLLERRLDDFRSQVNNEVMNRRLIEQKMEAQLSRLESAKRKKQDLEEKIADAHANLARYDAELRMERERAMTLTGQVQEFETVIHGSKAMMDNKQETIQILEDEIHKLKVLLDTQKHQFSDKFRKTSHDLKQKIETIESERQALKIETQQMTTSLEQSRLQLAEKNKENFKFQEGIINLEEKLRDNISRLKELQSNLSMEEQVQKELNKRFDVQEDDLKRLRLLLVKKTEEGTEAENKMMAEMNRVIQNLSVQMQDHRNARDAEIKLSQNYMKQMNKMELTLNTERAMHKVTKNSLRSQEEDNSSLRNQLQFNRKKSVVPRKFSNLKSRTRQEEIDDIIARAQTRAHHLISTGIDPDEARKSLSPGRDVNANSQILHCISPCESLSNISETMSASSSQMFLAFLPSTPNKTAKLPVLQPNIVLDQ